LQGHTAEELKATSDLVAAYFDSLEDKIAFLRTLSEQGHEDEAQLLCLVYIAGLANNLHPPGTKSGRSFSEALIRYGGDELFSLVMPDYLFENVPWKSAPLGLEIAVKNVLVTLPFGEGLHTRDLLDVLQSELSPAHLAWLKREVWRGSVAYAVYTTLRTGSVHFGGVGAALSFSHTYQGKPIPRVVFHNLYAALLSLAAHARKVSQESGEWFGQADWLSSGEQ